MSAATAAFLGSGRLDAGDGCTADHCQPGLRLAAELDPIADAGAGDYDICTGPGADSRTAISYGNFHWSYRPTQKHCTVANGQANCLD
jgi:hypothetical protein